MRNSEGRFRHCSLLPTTFVGVKRCFTGGDSAIPVELRHGAGFGEEPYPDFVTIAKGFRCGSRRVANKEDLDAALIEMLDAKGPFLLDVSVPYAEHVLPMIPSGQTVREMIKA